MTLDEAKRIYLAASYPEVPHHSDKDWRNIHAEREQIVAAKSDRAAGKIIEWWGCWDEDDKSGKYTATAFARKVRAEWRALKASGPS